MIEDRLLSTQFLGNEIRHILAFIGTIVLGLLLKRLGAIFLSKQSFRFFKKFAENQYSEEFVALLRKPIEQTLTLLVLYFAFDMLSFPASWKLADSGHYGLRWLILVCWQIALFVTITKVILGAIRFSSYVIAHREESKISPELSTFLRELMQVLVVILSIFAGLHFIFKFNITAIVASLGIGGLAVALAAQDTLANLLGSFIIYLDRPFKVGDLIEFGDTKGTVEHVGFRTTRIRTVDKSLLTVPNKKIVDAILNNITSSDMRRVYFTLGLKFTNEADRIQNIVSDIKKAITSHKDTGSDITVHFTTFEGNALNIEVTYFVQGNEYEKMVSVREELNFEIMRIIQSHGCTFAPPAQTIYINPGQG
jgi:MscS family membrane protein